MMCRYTYEFIDNANITYCPICGAETVDYYDDGTVGCIECDFHFGVVECEGE